MSPARGGAWTRLALTLLVAGGVLMLARVPLPGIDVSRINQVSESSDPTGMGILAFELNPIGSAAFYVEILALLIPRWRAWRVAGYSGRDRLWTRVRILGLVLPSVQAFFVLRWLVSFDRSAPALQLITWSRHLPLLYAVQAATLVAGTFLLYWLTRVIDRWGVGNGFAVILAAFNVPTMVGFVSSTWHHHDDMGNSLLLPVLLAAVVVVAVTRLAGGRGLRAQPIGPPGNELPALSSGAHPINLSHSLVALPTQLAAFGVTLFAVSPSTRTYRAAEVVLIAATCALLTWLFNRPRLVAQAWKRGGDSAAEPEVIDNRVLSAFARSLAQSIVICWALVAAEWMCADTGLTISILNLVILSCVAMDIAGELRFRRRHGALVAVWPVHRLYLLQGMLSALEVATIPAFPRCRRYRTLWNFLAPYAPVEIFVPRAQAEAAHAILAPLAGVDQAPGSSRSNASTSTGFTR